MYSQQSSYTRGHSLSFPSAPPVDYHNNGYQADSQPPPQDRRSSFQGHMQSQTRTSLYPDIGNSFSQQNYAPNISHQPSQFAPEMSHQPTNSAANYGSSQQPSQTFGSSLGPSSHPPASFLRNPTLHGGYGPVQPGSFSSTRSSMALMPNGLAPTPSSVINLRFRCKGLKRSDLLSQSDPFIVAYIQEAQQRGWREVGRTETIYNTADPTFATPLQVDFFFEEVQRLRIEVFDRDSLSEKLSDHDFLGCVEITMGQLMSSNGQSAVLKVLQHNKGRGYVHNLSGHVIIDAEEVATCADMIKVRFTATKLDNKDGWFGASDPFLNIYRLRDKTSDSHEASSWILVWRSEVVMDNCNPKWRHATISVQSLCNGDLTRPLKIECMDWEKSGKHQFIGSCTIKAAELVTGELRSVNLINSERQARKGRRYKNSGVLIVEQCEMFKQHTFAEFLRGGCEVSLIVGIDYTASNGSPSDPSSLHFVGGNYQGQMNDYQAAITATGAILEPYDSDKRIPVYGFGGLINGVVDHCFPLTFDPSQPEVEGISGIMKVYADSFQFVELHGPTKFAPLVHQAAAIARTFSTPVEQGIQGNLKYFVLLIVTDGAIMDMEETIDQLVQASTLPLSIVIVGVGNADFSAMNALDADGKQLINSRHVRAARDIVQFVPFNQFRGNPARLAKETMAEIPTQLLQYYKMRNIRPRAPLQRQGTSYLVNNLISRGMTGALDVGV